MNKSQIIVGIGGIAMMGFLYALPRQIVKKPAAPASTATAKAPTAQENSRDELHANMQLSEASLAQIKRLKEAWIQAKASEKPLWADSLAMAFYQAGRFDSAAYYMAWKAERSQSIQDKLRAADAYYEAFRFAMDVERANRFGEQARALYQQVLNENPTLLDAKAKMAMTYVTTSEPMQGIQMLLNILQTNPNHELALYNLGLLSMQRGAYDKATQRFEHLLEVNPQHAEAYLLLAESYLNLGKPKEAKATLQKALEHLQDPTAKAQIEQAMQELN
ncbi:tetratricopeptide (TPR) repeat protein [Thermonema lapsum]|uniref:Tetratricopeptide (TPR) repeat protein n=1 Tax=Thermonema lapsum TaxID=28195 RepID=A0A846MSN3_9BACT|nr:tetratricopeptide repeat protein [Thermonema lapsum]NIK74340.1 tetratricopeptide (TPR) repeat protein [Thermonema lapsum]